jgi:hypothetical protein
MLIICWLLVGWLIPVDCLCTQAKQCYNGYAFVHYEISGTGRFSAMAAISSLDNSLYRGVHYLVEPSRNFVQLDAKCSPSAQQAPMSVPAAPPSFGMLPPAPGGGHMMMPAPGGMMMLPGGMGMMPGGGMMMPGGMQQGVMMPMPAPGGGGGGFYQPQSAGGYPAPPAAYGCGGYGGYGGYGYDYNNGNCNNNGYGNGYVNGNGNGNGNGNNGNGCGGGEHNSSTGGSPLYAGGDGCYYVCDSSGTEPPADCPPLGYEDCPSLPPGSGNHNGVGEPGLFVSPDGWSYFYGCVPATATANASAMSFGPAHPYARADGYEVRGIAPGIPQQHGDGGGNGNGNEPLQQQQQQQQQQSMENVEQQKEQSGDSDEVEGSSREDAMIST